MMTSDAQERGMVEVICTIFSHQLPLAGLTVGFVREELVERMNINPQAVNHVDGEPADDSTVLEAGQVLCFFGPAADKH